MWRRQSHTLVPLTKLVTKQAKWTWGKEQQKAFDEMKKIIGKVLGIRPNTTSIP